MAEEEPILANPPTQEMADHVADYDRFTKLLKWGAIVCLIVGLIVAADHEVLLEAAHENRGSEGGGGRDPLRRHSRDREEIRRARRRGRGRAGGGR